MMKHIVMWTLKEEANGQSASANAKVMTDMLQALPGLIPELRYLEVSTRIAQASPACDMVLYTEFDTQEDLDAYQIHPEHQKCVAFIKDVVADRRVVDYWA